MRSPRFSRIPRLPPPTAPTQRWPPDCRPGRCMACRWRTRTCSSGHRAGRASDRARRRPPAPRGRACSGASTLPAPSRSARSTCGVRARGRRVTTPGSAIVAIPGTRTTSPADPRVAAVPRLRPRLAFGGFGSGHGGSVRLPASACGVLGLKPTNGRVTLAGMMPLSPSVDVPGIFARSARDVARLLGIVAGRDARDPRSSWLPVPDYEASVERGVAGLRIGVPQNFFLEGVAGDVALRLEESLQALAALGAEIVPVTVPAPEHLTELSRVLVYSEAAAIHGPWLRDHAETIRRRCGCVRPRALRFRRRPTIRRSSCGRDPAPVRRFGVLEVRRVAPADPRHSRADTGRDRRRWVGGDVGEDRGAGALHGTVQLPGAAGALGALRVHRQRPADQLPARWPAVFEATLLATAHAYDGVTRSTRRVPSLPT